MREVIVGGGTGTGGGKVAFRDRLLVRLVVVAVVAGLFAGVGGVLLAGQSARRALRAEIVERNAQIAEELATRMDARVDTAMTQLRMLRTRPALLSTSPEAAGDLRAVLNDSALFDELVLYDAQRDPVAAVSAQRLLDVADLPRLDPSVGEGARLLHDTLPPSVVLTVPVQSPPGQQVGTLAAVVPVEVLGVFIPRFSVHGGTVRSLVDDSGRILVHENRELVVSRREDPTVAARGSDRLATVVERADGPAALAVAPLELLPAAVVVEQPEAVALAPAAESMRLLSILLLVVAGVATLAVVVVGRWLLRPMELLAQSVGRLARGERGVRADEEGSGEIQLVAREFNRMAEALDRRSDEVEQLQRLSLLVQSRGDRGELNDGIVDGARALLDADGCGLCLAGERGGGQGFSAQLSTQAWSGLRRPDGLEALARRVVEQLAVVAEPQGAGELVALPIPAIDGPTQGALVAVRWAGGFSPREVELGEAFTAVAGVALDQVRRLEMERTIAEELQEAVDRRRQLIGGITHEFRTPLTCIEGFSSVLLDRWDDHSDEQRRGLVAKVHAHGRDMDDLVSRLLDFARLERSALLGRLGPVPLAQAVETAVEGLGPILDGRPVEQSVPDVTVLADGTLLARTLGNLLSNAAKYSPEGAPITIRAVADGQQVRIDVVDRGIGMSPEEAEQAFVPFWRAGNPEARSVRGLGLGLSLVAEYVRAMGGRVRVASAPDRGSTFSVTLRTAESRGR